MGKKKAASKDPPELSTSVFTFDELPEKLSAADDAKVLLKANARWNRTVRAAGAKVLAHYPSRFQSSRIRRQIEDGLHAMFAPRPPRSGPSKPRGAPRKPVTLEQIDEYRRTHRVNGILASKAKTAAHFKIDVKTLTRRLFERPASSK